MLYKLQKHPQIIKNNAVSKEVGTLLVFSYIAGIKKRQKDTSERLKGEKVLGELGSIDMSIKGAVGPFLLLT